MLHKIYNKDFRKIESPRHTGVTFSLADGWVNQSMAPSLIMLKSEDARTSQKFILRLECKTLL